MHKWYKDNAINIGIHAPLLTEAQYEILSKLLAENQDMSFEDILKELALKYEEKYDHLFDRKADAIALQKAFGITINDEWNFAGFTSNMELWWYNYHFSNLPEFLDGHTNNMFQQLMYNPH